MAGETPPRTEVFERLPPYAPHTAWSQLLDGLRPDIPSRIDKSYLKLLRFNQATRSMLLSALRFLGLVGQRGETTEELEELVNAAGDEYGKRLRALVQRRYGHLLAEVDLTTATPDLLQEWFKKVGARGDVARKCASFFVALAEDAGIPLSPHIRRHHRRPKGTSSASQGPRSTGLSGVNRPASRRRLQATTTAEGAGRPLAASLVDKFPPADSAWDHETMNKWLEDFGQLLKIVLREEGPRGERAVP